MSLPKTRHRAVNLFLQGYEKSWIEAEEHYFEDKLIEDLAVSEFQFFYFLSSSFEYKLQDIVFLLFFFFIIDWSSLILDVCLF